MKLKNKSKLKKLFKNKDYDYIAVWSDGSWDVDDWEPTKNGQQPLLYLRQNLFLNLTDENIKTIIKNLDNKIKEEIT